MVVGGTATDPSYTARDGMLVERFTTKGELDRSFGKHGAAKGLPDASRRGAANAAALGKRGRIVVAGSAAGSDSFDRIAVAELDKRGKLVRSFGAHGVTVADGAQDLGRLATAQAVATKGKRIIVAGGARPDLQTTQGVVAGFKANGKLDRGFGKAGSFVVPANVAGGAAAPLNAVAVHHGAILAAGAAAGSGTTPAFALAVELSGGGNPRGSFGKRGIATAPSEKGSLTPDPIPGAYGAAFARHGVAVLGGFYQDSGLTEVGLWSFDSHGKSIRRGTVRTQLGSVLSGRANALAIGRGGRILAAGASSEPGGPPKKGVVVAYRGFG